MIKQKMYLITPTLLNSWLNIFNCVDFVRESENDECCLEDKQTLAVEKAKEEFLKTLNREKIEPNKFMLDGINFEQECYDGKHEFYDIIKHGAWQIVGKKEKTINNKKFLLYGRLDCLKGGVIYDIKKVVRYTPQKYLKSCQHWFYLELFKNASRFEYLVFDGKKSHKEIYHREDMENIDTIIADFIKWLETNNLMYIYEQKWLCK